VEGDAGNLEWLNYYKKITTNQRGNDYLTDESVARSGGGGDGDGDVVQQLQLPGETTI